jgi:hypothetical protein
MTCGISSISNGFTCSRAFELKNRHFNSSKNRHGFGSVRCSGLDRLFVYIYIFVNTTYYTHLVVDPSAHRKHVRIDAELREGPDGRVRSVESGIHESAII